MHQPTSWSTSLYCFVWRNARQGPAKINSDRLRFLYPALPHAATPQGPQARGVQKAIRPYIKGRKYPIRRINF
ncbi:MAG: hypothetical protein PHQ17_08215 [Methanobacterium sp.]|nr:hypothetical protein [Methanobacterium sp.]